MSHEILSFWLVHILRNCITVHYNQLFIKFICHHKSNCPNKTITTAATNNAVF